MANRRTALNLARQPVICRVVLMSISPEQALASSEIWWYNYVKLVTGGYRERRKPVTFCPTQLAQAPNRQRFGRLALHPGNAE